MNESVSIACNAKAKNKAKTKKSKKGSFACLFAP